MIILYLIVGLVGGIFAGMGMGGGTVLVPLLSLILGLAQKQAQLYNILSFMALSILLVPIYTKSKLIDVFPAIIFSIVGCLFSFVSSMIITNVDDRVLKVLYGIFLLAIGLFELLSFIIKKNQKK